ncbi:hypothetical protein F0562_003070 [Nyssa sinensis]|uniref:RING-type E3 ubiquitin transferase n=1 Tax=Nyssa sinensis TaxID=561372 RepID=A0A5J5BUM6_9ASTE|nr:hypothetical protein F0562_003070 [Nyssa sinensis]
METQAEKVYVAIGTDLQDGFGTLKWALQKWSSHSMSIVILYAANNPYKDFVYTPFGKLPASSVSEEKLKVLRKIEEGEIDKLLSKYIAFCGKVKVEILKIEKYDEPIQTVLVELISRLRITKLVMGITFMKSSSWKSRSAISGSFYVFRQKPDFCELFIICGGKLVFLREENNEGFVEDDQGVMVAKVRERNSLKGWLGKMFAESATIEKNPGTSPSSSTSNDSPYQWENYVQEIENYFEQLLSSNSDEEDHEMENDILQTSPTEPDMPQNMSTVEKSEVLKNKICKVREVIQLKRKEAKANVERRARAEWAICSCSRRAEELEARMKEEMANRVDLNTELDSVKEDIYEVQSEVEEKKNKLNSILELQRELANKLQSSSLAKSLAGAQLEKAVTTRVEMVREIEELRRQRDVLQRRIEFCKERDAIGMATRLNDLGFNYKEFTAEEIRAATDDFSERLRLKSSGDLTSVYIGHINHITVAIKLYDSINVPSLEAFQATVKLLGHIRHPHLVAVIGFCSELRCIIFEYMHNGCLRDALFSLRRSSKRRNQGLNWHARIRIAAEVCSGLGFLHSAQPKPIVHGNLNPSKILLDCNLAAKICFRLDWCCNESYVLSDMQAFGNLVLQLLTGRNWAGLVEEAIVMDHEALIGVLDEMAGDWPLELAVELAGIAMRCLSTNEGLATVMRDIDKVRKKADDLVVGGECEVAIEGGVDIQDSSNVPSFFLCPIFQVVMKNPHVAADGFSYELEAIEEWVGTGHDTSPMTDLKLSHRLLTPNHTLRSLIHDWHNKRSIPLNYTL